MGVAGVIVRGVEKVSTLLWKGSVEVGVYGMGNMPEEKPGMSVSMSRFSWWGNCALAETAICGADTRRISGLDKAWRDISTMSSVLYNRS